MANSEQNSAWPRCKITIKCLVTVTIGLVSDVCACVSVYLSVSMCVCVRVCVCVCVYLASQCVTLYLWYSCLVMGDEVLFVRMFVVATFCRYCCRGELAVGHKGIYLPVQIWYHYLGTRVYVLLINENSVCAMVTNRLPA